MSFGALTISNGPFLRSSLPPYMMPGGYSMTRGGINAPAAAATVPSLQWTGYGDLGRAEKRMKSRDVRGRGGYVYRQFEDGSILVIGGPALVGTTITKDSDLRRWTAITTEIGWFKAQPGTFVQVLPDILTAVTSVSNTTAQALAARNQPALPVEPVVPVPESSPSSPLPWIIGGVAAVALAVALMSSR